MLAQAGLFAALAIVPWATLQPHDKCILGDEMRAGASLQQPPVGSVGADFAHLRDSVYSGPGEQFVGRGSKASNC